MELNLETITKTIGAVTASLALVGGGYTLWDKVKPAKPILTWHGEYFSIESGPAGLERAVVVAREKHRDDCEVTSFKLEIKDSQYQVHDATSSVSVFSGPASHKIDKFGYRITLADPKKVAPGLAVLMANIKYKCPEGEVIVNYPDHPNLTFNITKETK
jgi:hypothetical protein